ncbi:hypothetical protein TUM17386_27060 [Shewanella algae]|nr:hypothetical protein TUM17386_27060 [Shewanella algae]
MASKAFTANKSSIVTGLAGYFSRKTPIGQLKVCMGLYVSSGKLLGGYRIKAGLRQISQALNAKKPPCSGGFST